MYDLGLDWSEQERERIIEYAKEVLNSYRVLKRRERMMLQAEAPDGYVVMAIEVIE